MPTRKMWETFLKTLGDTGNVTASAHAAKVGRQTAYDRRAADSEFAAEWDQALEMGIDMLEDEARRRAMEKSDLLMIFMLKAARPDVYRDKAPYARSSPDDPTADLSDMDRANRVAAIFERAKARAEGEPEAAVVDKDPKETIQ